MGDHVRDPFDDIDSGDDEIEKPPTPKIHHGGESPEAPGFSDVSDSEEEENTGKEATKQQPEDSNNSSSVGSPVEGEGNAKEDIIIEAKPDASPLYDQEISPISSTSATADDQENTVAKVDHKEEEASSEAEKLLSKTIQESETKRDHLERTGVEGDVEVSSQLSASRVEVGEGEHDGDLSVTENTTDRRRTISSGAATDDDLEMPISPLGLGLSGPESEIVDDILKSDVSKLLPGSEDESKEGPIGIIDIEMIGHTFHPLTSRITFAGCVLESEEEAGEQLIQDIFGASDEEEEFVGFGQEDIEVTRKKKGARDRKQHSLSLGSEVDDEEVKARKDDLETMKVPKPKTNKSALDDDDDDDDDDLDDKQVFVSDFDLMIQKKKEMNRNFRRKRKNVDIISDSDDAVAHMITQMKEVVEEDRMLNGAKQAATKKLKMLPSVLTHLHKADLQTTFLELGVLPVLKDWLSPLPDGSLPHLQIREGLLKVLVEFPTMDSRTLKMSGIGKAVMYLCRHPRETRDNKKIAGKLINDWARPIFGVTSNFKSLSREEREQRDYQNMSKKRRLSSVDSDGGKTPKSIDSALQSDKKAVKPGDKGFVMRARVPTPSNKDYVVRPQNAVERMDFSKKPQKTMNRFEKQKRKFEDKKKLLNRGSQRAVNISIEGRKMGL
ncbi:protein IWS1 homolog [Stylophora pistillata]|uniref:protein IWS1 homolog n=1 Tax=Stylophora pistillata TaxID=50429 RepID=UPI000C04A696|nr:protein IWS1 homolog [Stylophora pistillata]